MPRSDVSLFLCFLNDHFTLATHTSAKLKNPNKIIDLSLSTHIRSTLLFICGQDACEFRRKEDDDKGFVFMKSLYITWKNILYGMTETLC